jgi:hypothetical protein
MSNGTLLRTHIFEERAMARSEAGDDTVQQRRTMRRIARDEQDSTTLDQKQEEKKE